MNNVFKVCDATVCFTDDYDRNLKVSGVLACQTIKARTHFYFCSNFEEMNGMSFYERFGFKYTWDVFGFGYNQTKLKKLLKELRKCSYFDEDTMFFIAKKIDIPEEDLRYDYSVNLSGYEDMCFNDEEEYYNFSLNLYSFIGNNPDKFKEIEL